MSLKIKPNALAELNDFFTEYSIEMSDNKYHGKITLRKQ